MCNPSSSESNSWFSERVKFQSHQNLSAVPEVKIRPASDGLADAGAKPTGHSLQIDLSVLQVLRQGL